MKMERVAERQKESVGEDVALASEGQPQSRLPLDWLRTDGQTQMRERLDEETVKEYQNILAAEYAWPFPPVEVFSDGGNYWIWDGFHRVEAARRAYALRSPTDRSIPVNIKQGGLRDAVLMAAGANARHGLRRTNADKRKAVETLLKDEEWSQWSDREIARRCAVSDRLVNTIRAELEATANIRSQTERRGADGRVINVASIKAAAKVRYVPIEEFVPFADELPSRQLEEPEPSVVPSSAAASRVQLPALGKCAVCGRPLSDPEHAAAGCGPVCAAKKAAQTVEEASWIAPLADDDRDIAAGEALQRWAQAAREVMGGIDLDPASSEEQQAIVGADYWCYPDDGLLRAWGGRVFLCLLEDLGNWPVKVLSEWYDRGSLEVVAIFPAKHTGEQWFQRLLVACNCVCFLRQDPVAAFYMGQNGDKFADVFHHLGVTMQEVDL